jgi:hypothetical protein
MSQVRDAPLEHEPAGVDVVHPGDLDRHAVVGAVPVVQDDEGVGAVGADPSLSRCGEGVARRRRRSNPGCRRRLLASIWLTLILSPCAALKSVMTSKVPKT